ncbi:MAG: hypothetical protein AVDCRST_MAG61-2046, partial [uncultured Friedmanniella sp.]
RRGEGLPQPRARLPGRPPGQGGDRPGGDLPPGAQRGVAGRRPRLV